MFRVIEEKIAVPLIIILTLFVLGGIYYSVNLADKEFEEATEYAPIKIEKKDSTENWQTYRDEEYGFEVKYPESGAIGCAAPGGYANPCFRSGPDTKWLNINIIDPLRFNLGDNFETLNLGLEDYVRAVWEINKNEEGRNGKEVGPITEITVVDGRKAYQFTLTKSFKNELGEHVINEKRAYTYFESDNGIKFRVEIPEDNEALQEIFSTFKFIE